jgi:hypothetical protein
LTGQRSTERKEEPMTLKPESDEEFIGIADMDAWTEFLAINDGLTEYGTPAELLALARNQSLVIGGGASPIFRIGFIDS